MDTGSGDSETKSQLKFGTADCWKARSGIVEQARKRKRSEDIVAGEQRPHKLSRYDSLLGLDSFDSEIDLPPFESYWSKPIRRHDSIAGDAKLRSGAEDRQSKSQSDGYAVTENASLNRSSSRFAAEPKDRLKACQEETPLKSAAELKAIKHESEAYLKPVKQFTLIKKEDEDVVRPLRKKPDRYPPYPALKREHRDEVIFDKSEREKVDPELKEETFWDDFKEVPDHQSNQEEDHETGDEDNIEWASPEPSCTPLNEAQTNHETALTALNAVYTNLKADSNDIESRHYSKQTLFERTITGLKREIKDLKQTERRLTMENKQLKKDLERTEGCIDREEKEDRLLWAKVEKLFRASDEAKRKARARGRAKK